MEILISIGIYLLIISGISSINFGNGRKFENSLIIYIFVVSIYAIVITKGQTLYWPPIILTLILIFKGDNSFKLSYPKIEDVFSGGVIWFIFFFIYFLLNDFEFGVLHEDYIIYSRIAHYNDIVGVENTKAVYNFFESGLSNEVYHFSELWGIALIRYVTSLPLLSNYVFILSPVLSFIIYLGFKKVFPSNGFKIALFSVIIILFVSFPYDKLVQLFEIHLPILGVGDSILSIKNIFIIPIFLYLFNSLRNGDFSFLIFSIIIFAYPLLIPVVIPSISVYFLFVYNKSFKFYISPIFVVLFFFGYSVYFPSGIKLFDFNNFFNGIVLIKVFYVAVILGLSIYLFNRKFIDNGVLDKDYYSISLLIIFISVLFWILFYDNINSNQFFRNVFHCILCIQITYLIGNALLNKIYSIFIIYLFVFVSPFLLNKFRFLPASSLSNSKFISSLNKNSKIVFIPEFKSDQSIYEYIDYMYSDLNNLYLSDEYLNILSVSSAFPVSKKIDSEIELNMLSHYRETSILYSLCGELNLDNIGCLIRYCNDNNVDYIISSIQNTPLRRDYYDLFLNKYYVYQVKSFY